MQATRFPDLTADRIAAASKARSEPPALTERRKAAWERLPSTDFSVPRGAIPSRTRLRDVDLLALAAGAVAAPAPQVNRSFKGEGIQVLSWSEAMTQHPNLVQRLFSTHLPEDGKLELLQEALPAYGTVILVGRNANPEAPVNLDIEVPAGGAALHTLIVTEPLSKVEVIERLHGRAEGSFVSQRVEIFAGEGSHVTYAAVQDLPLTATYSATKRAHQERDAKVVWVDTQIGSSMTRSEVTSRLLGPGSGVQNFGAFLGSGNQEFDLSARGFHEAAHTENQIFTKGALRDDARSIFFGHVHIMPPGASSAGHQKSATLLLSENARADSIPVLDVENNDVSASHGSTVGQVDKEQLFYLRSRGLSEAEATRMIVEGFFQPLLAEIPHEGVREELTAAIGRRLVG
ncbi:MAG TPA: Fe-S cluster assembly protein SufD [Candidatus Thermoplasmatota archaeon]|nr:Fe-S cluster assembly protein SufD [Candidatus Thermoplasmatota archaeon]